MKKLLIYIPTYNRIKNLKFSIKRLLHELAGLEDLITIHISDNCSTDGTYNFLTSLKHPSVKFSRNASNVGPARNLCLAFELSAEAEYTWIIGDDDFVLGGALRQLLGTIRGNQNIDFFFLNTLSYDENNKDEVIKSLEENNSIPKLESGYPRSQIHFDFKCELSDLFNPQVDSVFMGALMCYVWRSELVKNIIADEDLSFDLSKPKSCYPHAFNFLHCLKPTSPSMHISYLATVNFWHGGVDWGNKGYDLAVTQGLGIILYEAIRLGYVNEDNRISYFAHYMAKASPAYKRFLENPNDGFQDQLVDFHPQLAEMLLRYGVTPLYKPHKNIWFRLAELSPRKVYIILGNILRRLKTSISRWRLGG
jgi:glycosyltransferase involved in cell wall biosynthesis